MISLNIHSILPSSPNPISFQLQLMETPPVLRAQDINKEEPILLFSPTNPNRTTIQTVYLSNIDQTVAFPVETVFFYHGTGGSPASSDGIAERVKRAVSDGLLIPYYFMAGRIGFNSQTRRLELVCNNAGVLFSGATSSLRLHELGNLSLPNPSFQHLILRTDRFVSIEETPILTIQVTKFRCGGFSMGFVTNHSILDGRSAAEMLVTLAAICRGEAGMNNVDALNLDRSCIKPRNPPEIRYEHTEYTKLDAASSIKYSSFTSSLKPPPPPSVPALSETHTCKLFSFTAQMITSLKKRSAMATCSTFEAIVAQVWRARTMAVFTAPENNNNSTLSSVFFAVDIRAKMTPTLPDGFVGNGVITAAAAATVKELREMPFSYCVERVKEAIERVSRDEYVRSVIDWLEVHRGVPSTMDGRGFYVSAWWKLPFHELDFGHGRPVFGGPVASGVRDFVLLLTGGGGAEKINSGIDVWIVLEKEKMERFMTNVFDC